MTKDKDKSGFNLTLHQGISERIFLVLADGRPRTLKEICKELGGDVAECSVSACTRDLRKKRCGAHQIDTFRDGGKFYYAYIPVYKSKKKVKGK